MLNLCASTVLNVWVVLLARFAGVDLPKITCIAQQSAKAIQHLHDQGLVHCRIGPRKVQYL